MPQTFLRFHDQTVRIDHPDEVAPTIGFLFSAHFADPDTPDHLVSVKTQDDGRYRLSHTAKPDVHVVTPGHFPEYVMDAVLRGLVTDLRTGIALHCGAVSRNETTVLVSGKKRLRQIDTDRVVERNRV